MEQQNKYRVIVSGTGNADAHFHAAFLAQVSPEAAERLTAEFEKTANSVRADGAEMSVAHRGIYSQKCLPFYPV
ncbi:MAG: hypothetical protein ACLSF4_03315 [Hominenteromicrobium sp.]|uniref:hypothetical protein n=1 Tax=Hominenteromicrobium sp. TaxID=3073581 RepID=UPI003991F2EF